jgi:hypothetical protein
MTPTITRGAFDGVDQITDPARPTRRCTICQEPESKRRDLRATQFIAEPRTLKETPEGRPRWQNTVHWACQKCRRDAQGSWRIPSYHPQTGVADFVCYAQQFVPDVRCITLQEPWAWLISQGFKDCENRKWHTVFQGRVFIHSGLSFAADYRNIENWVGTHMGIMLPGKEWLKKYHVGRIVAVAEFGQMVAKLPDSQWKMQNQWAWPINWCHAVNPTDPVKGMLGLWRLPTDNMRVSVLPL